MNCEWCNAECDGTLNAIVNLTKYTVCETCLNHLGNEEYEILIKRIQHSGNTSFLLE